MNTERKLSADVGFTNCGMQMTGSVEDLLNDVSIVLSEADAVCAAVALAGTKLNDKEIEQALWGARRLINFGQKASDAVNSALAQRGDA